MPTNPFDAMDAPVKELHHTRAHTGDLVTYVDSGYDPEPYEDDSLAWDANDPEPIDIVIERSSVDVRYGGGIEVEEDAVITIDPAELTNEVIGGGRSRPASEIVDRRTETRYRVVSAEYDGGGLRLLQCKRIDE
jgi:hypothetical protein